MKILKFLISPVFMGVLFVLFAISMAVATFLENDFGSAAAYSMVYNTFWFELILLLLSINLIGQIIDLKLYRKAKLTVFLFHSSFLVMILGAAITRYFGYEGSIHIREGAEENRCYSTGKYIGYKIKDSNGRVLSEQLKSYSMTSVSADNYSTRITAGSEKYDLVLSQIIPNAIENVTEGQGGVAVASFMVMNGGMEMDKLKLEKGETKKAGNHTIGFDAADSTDIILTADNSGFSFTSRFDITEKAMMGTDSIIHPKDSQVRLKTMQVYNIGGVKIIPQDLSLSGVIKPVAADPKTQETGENAFIFNITANGQSTMVTLWDKRGQSYSTADANINGKIIELFYGSKVTDLPFTIKLDKFILDRYPGSNSPSGYKSDVVLIDKASNIERPYHIFMNNILKYKGYRFFQSSFDQDEKGTILSVNHDMVGMLVSYTGYFLLFLFIILSIINKKSVFHSVNTGYWSSPFRKTFTLFALILLLSGLNTIDAQKFVPDKKASEEFGKVLVQDQKGRTKPMFTLSNDILRKVTHQNDFEGMTSMQVFLGVYLDFQHWQEVPLIRVSNKDIQRKLGIRGNMAAFTDIIDTKNGNTYKLSGDVQAAYAKSPGERNKTDKEVMKIDERLNIIYMIYTGEFLKVMPLKDKTHNWGSPEEALKTAISKEDSLYLKNVMPMFAEALQNKNITNANQISASITDYQKRFAGYTLPSASKTNAEVFYYKAKIFERLFPFYATVGLIMLISLITMLIRTNSGSSRFIKLLGWLLFAGFIFHTIGLSLRWYIAGHSPMSNGYESMIFISWVTLFAGFIFARKSAFALSATAVLGSMTLMVAHLSFMDPEITNLVPVLKSYWLTLHVSVITGSYGFLGFGFMLGLINMILLSLSNKKNIERIGKTIEELTVLNYKTLTLGLYLLTIGTFLGAVWANESWGRYWGWDPKETWSLITIIMYSLVIHSRMIPGLKDIYSFNILSLFAFSGVLMTYFGVNYYLSGMHSYAAGDPVPVPGFVYVAVIALTAISFLAYLRYSNWKKIAQEKK
jgi:cytochrome c-type biogenesis protein CcsB